MTPGSTYPGVYVEEIPSGARTITGVATSVTAFIGAAKRGPVNRPVCIRSFADFEQRFGGLVANLELGYAVRLFFLNGGTDSWVVRIARKATVAQVQKSLRSLATVDLFNLLVLPGITVPAILSAAAAYCRPRRAFLVVDAPQDARTPQQMEQMMQSGAMPKTSYGALYYPWLQTPDPLNSSRPRSTAPSGAVAGVFARTDGQRGVWKPPSGTDATLAGVKGLEHNVTDAENGRLNPRGVNCLRVLPGFGPTVWGARTLEGDDQLASEWKFVPIRRMALFLEESLQRGTQWVVFEPNGEPLWAQIRLNVGAFLDTLFRQGAFQGRTPREAYFVKCDKATTTADDIGQGMVNIVIGFAPLKPAEFVVIKIQHKVALPKL
jgi:phage tail sheath protein FI